MATETFGSNRMWGLKELPLPEPVSYFPQTIGWAVAGVVLALLLGWWIWRRWKIWQSNEYRRRGAKLLAEIGASPDKVRELPFILRQSALNAAPRSDVASLRGPEWIDWLNESGGKQLFLKTDAETFDFFTYRQQDQKPIDDAECGRLVAASMIWMRDHHVAV